ncbi:MFS transporter [Patescibacteria group bacterium]|nr:MFS transporter [Patescibacteria group bacterium]MBU1890136.1 MFS transporter [Patescibacteria group bacterium]
MNLQKYIGIIRYPNFLKLWGAQACTKLAENMMNFSLVILVFQLTQSSFMVSLLVVLISIPPILLSAAAGVIADIRNRKTILVLSNLLRFFLVIIAIVFYNQAYVLLGIAFLLSVIAQFFSPAEVSSIPTLVKKEDLFTANSFYQFTSYGMFLAGYTIAGPLLAHWGAHSLFLLIMALYAASTLLTSWLPPLVDHLKNLSVELPRIFDWRELTKRMAGGIRYIWGHKIIRFVIFQAAVVFSIERAFISLAPSFSQNFLHLDVEGLSLYVILPTGIGTLCGVLLANKLKHRVNKGKLITTGMFLDGFALLALALWTHIYSLVQGLGFNVSVEAFIPILVIILAWISGFADPFILVSVQTTIHERTPAEDRGRVFGGLYTFSNIMGLIPVLVIGALTSIININMIVICLGIVILAVTAQGIFFFRRYSLGTE